MIYNRSRNKKGGVRTKNYIFLPFVHDEFAFEKDKAQSVALAAAPVLVKYKLELPLWIAQYMSEILLLGAIGGLVLSSVSQIKTLKRCDSEKVVNEKNGGEHAAD